MSTPYEDIRQLDPAIEFDGMFKAQAVRSGTMSLADIKKEFDAGVKKSKRKKVIGKPRTITRAQMAAGRIYVSRGGAKV